MERVRIVTDSTADIPRSFVEALGITVVPLNVHFGRETYRDGVDIKVDDFYQKLVTTTVHPTTSQPSVGAFLETYERLGAEADHIFSIHISSKLSGTLNSAQLARSSYRGGATIEVVDSKVASLGLGLVVISAAEAAHQGASVPEIRDLVARLVERVHVRFFVETLEYLQRGGRIGRAQALLGGLLNIKPFLRIQDGEVHPVEKLRTRARALDRLAEFVESFPAIDRVAIAHINTPDDVERLCERIAPVVPRERIVVGRIGPVIGTHVGPAGMGVMVLQGE